MPRNDCWPQARPLSARIGHVVAALIGSLPGPEIIMGGAIVAMLCSA